MTTIRIYPRYKLLVTYDVRPEVYTIYQRYILSEFIPHMQEMGMYMVGAWHTAYGAYPSRQIEFVMEDLDRLQEAIADERLQALEEKLRLYTENYDRKLVRFRDGFQFSG